MGKGGESSKDGRYGEVGPIASSVAMWRGRMGGHGCSGCWKVAGLLRRGHGQKWGLNVGIGY